MPPRSWRCPPHCPPLSRLRSPYGRDLARWCPPLAPSSVPGPFRVDAGRHQDGTAVCAPDVGLSSPTNGSENAAIRDPPPATPTCSFRRRTARRDVDSVVAPTESVLLTGRVGLVKCRSRRVMRDRFDWIECRAPRRACPVHRSSLLTAQDVGSVARRPPRPCGRSASTPPGRRRPDRAAPETVHPRSARPAWRRTPRQPGWPCGG